MRFHMCTDRRGDGSAGTGLRYVDNCLEEVELCNKTLRDEKHIPLVRNHNWETPLLTYDVLHENV